MKVAVTGGRTYSLTDQDLAFLDSINAKLKISLLISGNAQGVDRQAEAWAIARNISIKQNRPDWNTFGHSAGFRANEEMAQAADALIAFPGGSGTQHMINACIAHEITVYESPSRGLGCTRKSNKQMTVHPFQPGLKYTGIISQIRYLPLACIHRQELDFRPEVMTVSDEVCRSMDYSQAVEVTAFRNGPNNNDAEPMVTLSDGHHRMAAAIQTGRSYLPVSVKAINAKGEKLNALVACSLKIEAALALRLNPSMRSGQHAASIHDHADVPQTIAKKSDRETFRYSHP